MSEQELLQAAAARLLRQQVAGQPQQSELLSEPFARLETDPEDRAEHLHEVLRNISEKLPDFAHVGTAEQAEQRLHTRLHYDGEEEGPWEHRLTLEGMADQQSRPWTRITCEYRIDIGDGEDELPPGTVNTLNDRIPGGVWSQEGTHLTFQTGTVLPSTSLGDSRQKTRIVEHILDAAAYGSQALEEGRGGHPAHQREQQNETFQNIIGEHYHIDLLQQQVEAWREQLPETLQHAVEIHRTEEKGREGSESLIVDLPGQAEEGQQHLRLLLDLPGAEDALPGIPQGIHAYSMLPGSFEPEEANEWCERLNSQSQGDDSIPVTTGWQYGNWYHTPDDDGQARITYFAVIAHKHLNLCRLEDEVGGIVREVGSKHRRICVAARYRQMLESGTENR